MFIHSDRFRKLYKTITEFWWKESHSLWPYLLLPFSLLYTFCSIVRRLLYLMGVLRTHHFSVPVVVVGNLTVGGTGKTPLVIHLVNLLKEQGYHPGVVSRAYGVKNLKAPREVTLQNTFTEVGDEPLLMKQHLDCPIVVCPKRVQAIQYLLQRHPECDIIISDDGLQHYAMGRNVEILVIDGERRFGNGFCLPVGPLREPIYRLREANLVVCNGGTPKANEFAMQLVPGKIVAVTDANKQAERRIFSRAIVHAIAGIGNPIRFFYTLRCMTLRFFEHAFPDHYPFSAKDIDFGENAVVIMTEKDAVKCRSFADARHWFLRISTKIDHRFEESFLKLIQQSKGKKS